MTDATCDTCDTCRFFRRADDKSYGDCLHPITHPGSTGGQRRRSSAVACPLYDEFFPARVGESGDDGDRPMKHEHPDDFALHVERVHHEFARMAERCQHRDLKHDVCRALNSPARITFCGIGACPVLMLGETESDR